MNRWTHPTCIDCYTRLEPGREPFLIRVTDPEDGSRVRMRRICCFCGRETDAGIFYRHDPRATQCAGTTGYHEKRDGASDLASATGATR